MTIWTIVQYTSMIIRTFLMIKKVSPKKYWFFFFFNEYYYEYGRSLKWSISINRVFLCTKLWLEWARWCWNTWPEFYFIFSSSCFTIIEKTTISQVMRWWANNPTSSMAQNQKPPPPLRPKMKSPPLHFHLCLGS